MIYCYVGMKGFVFFQIASKPVFDPDTLSYPVGFNYLLSPSSAHLQFCSSVPGSQRVYHSNPASSLNLASPCQSPVPCPKNDVIGQQQQQQAHSFLSAANHNQAELPANQNQDQSNQSALSPFAVPALKNKYPAVARSSSCVTPRRSVSAYKMSSNSSKEILK